MMHKSLVRRLDLITLQLFVAVFEEGTLTRAANREAIAVSAASKRLMELEQVLGVSLFVRRAKGMELTAAGETLLHQAASINRFGDVVRFLELGVDPTLKDDIGYTFQHAFFNTPERLLNPQAKAARAKVRAWLRSRNIPLEERQ